MTGSGHGDLGDLTGKGFRDLTDKASTYSPYLLSAISIGEKNQIFMIFSSPLHLQYKLSIEP